MRRDIGNEVVVAIAAVGILACALTFGIVLSLSNNTPAATVVRATETPSTIEQAALPSDTPPTLATVHSVVVPPTDSPTATRRPTRPITTQTSIPAMVVPLTATRTPIPPTFTPTATRTPRATFTATAPPPTATRTPIPPTFTPTATRTPRATFTATAAPPTATRTPIPPTKIFTPTAAATFTPTTTFMLSDTPSSTATFRPIFTPTATRACPLPTGWRIYFMQGSETLYDVAQAVNSSVEDLRAANCLTNADLVGVGFGVYVPRPPVGAVVTGVPIFPQGTPPTKQGCTKPGVRILTPASGQEVSGTFNLVGAASLPPSGYYRIDIRSNSVNTFTPYSRATQPVIGGVLAVINSNLFGDGLYWIRLTVFDQTGRATESCAVPMIFR